MTDQFVAEIRIFGFNFPPTGWAFCNGQLMPISQNTALFSLLGTFYGGDGKSTFALPDLQDSAPMQQGQGQGLSQRFLGQQGGSPFITLLESEMPAHSHSHNVSGEAAVEREPGNQKHATGDGVSFYGEAAGATTTTAPQTLTSSGGSLPHNNMMPYLAMNFCIALQGIFPPRG